MMKFTDYIRESGEDFDLASLTRGYYDEMRSELKKLQGELNRKNTQLSYMLGSMEHVHKVLEEIVSKLGTSSMGLIRNDLTTLMNIVGGAEKRSEEYASRLD